MKEYKLVTENTPAEFSSEVSTCLNIGWECQGSVSMVFGEGYLVYAQALTREMPEEKK